MHCNMILNSEENLYECSSFLYVSDKQDNCSLQDYDDDRFVRACMLCWYKYRRQPLPHESFIEFTYVLLLAYSKCCLFYNSLWSQKQENALWVSKKDQKRRKQDLNMNKKWTLSVTMLRTLAASYRHASTKTAWYYCMHLRCFLCWKFLILFCLVSWKKENLD